MKPWPPPGRIPCLVIGCRRTASKEKYPEEGTEIICGKCWRLIDKRLRRVLRRLEKLAETGQFTHRKWLQSRRMWAKARAQAIERKMGIRA